MVQFPRAFVVVVSVKIRVQIREIRGKAVAVVRLTEHIAPGEGA
jgi:hypothetical protein